MSDGVIRALRKEHAERERISHILGDMDVVAMDYRREQTRGK